MNQTVQRASSHQKIWIGLLALVSVTIAAASIWRLAFRQRATAIQYRTYAVRPVDLEVKLRKDGELQAVKSFDILCGVEGQTTIQSLVPEGTRVKQGDVMMTLDSSRLEERLVDTELSLLNSQNNLARAVQMVETQESQNAARQEAADVALQIAQLELKRYEEGAYPQQLTNSETDLKMAQINASNAQEKLGQTQSLFNMGFTNKAALQADAFTVTSAAGAKDKAAGNLKVLTEYTHAMNLASKRNAVTSAEQELARTKSEDAADLVWRQANLQEKQHSVALLTRRREHLQAQIKACTITAPADGLVTYAMSGDRFNGTVIEEGALVRESQRLICLPETSSMKAVVRLSETLIPQIHPGQTSVVKIVGVSEPVSGCVTKISVLADGRQRFNNPDIREYPIDVTLDQTPAGMLPGMGAIVEILVDGASDVLAAPIAAVYSNGNDHYLWIMHEGRLELRKVEIGLTNGAYAQLLGDFVHAGEQVVLLDARQMQAEVRKAGI